jgi:Ca-activated chloride channel family protein
VQSLPALLVAAAILFLAVPQKFGIPKERRALTNVQFALDVSGSMTAPFGSEGTRYDAAMGAINKFIKFPDRKGDAFGLTVFGNNFLHWVPLTNDVSAFECALPFLRPELMPDGFGGTEIGKALRACAKVLREREQGDRMIVLVSDGYSWDLNGGNDVAVANELKRDEITVFTVHAADGDPPDPLQVICGTTGGAVFAANDPDALDAVFKRIDEMKRAPLEKTAADLNDNFGWLAIVGLILLGCWLLGQLGLRYTPW